MDLFLCQHAGGYLAAPARDGGLFCLSQRPGPAANDLREPSAGEFVGYSTQPVELFGVLPAGLVWRICLRVTLRMATAMSFPRSTSTAIWRYDIYWDEKGEVRRRGDDATLVGIWQSPGCALVIPFREKLLFAVLGPASGFTPKNNRLVDHCTPDAEGGAGWGEGIWDHWPIGWMNSQAAYWKAGIALRLLVWIDRPVSCSGWQAAQSFSRDYCEYCKDMDFNRWTERHVFYVLLGSAGDWDSIRRIGRSWLDQGGDCARPESIANLK